MDKIKSFINEWWHVLSLLGLLALFFIHLHSDVTLMKYVQGKHEEQIKELVHNQDVAIRIIAGHINGGN